MSAARPFTARALRPLIACVRQSHALRSTSTGNLPSHTMRPQAALINTQKAVARSYPLVRPFHSSQPVCASGDDSTIDFAYLPQEVLTPPLEGQNMVDGIRVPILPDNYDPPRFGVHAPLVSDYEPTPTQEISLAAAESTHISTPSSMHDVQDNTATNTDFHHFTETLTNAARKVTLGTDREKAEGEEDVAKAQGMVRQVWKGFLDDVFGSSQKSKS